MSVGPLAPRVPPRPAATVLLVRDADAGPEVFLMKRSGHGIFGGLHVFPGGKVDPIDRADHWDARTTGPNDAHASRILGIPTGGLAYWIACIRECFEEAGVLLARGADDRILPFADPVRRTRFESWRDQLNAGRAGALEMLCDQENLRLATDRLAYLSHWITPIGLHARFDTRFFVARAPSEQIALHDGHEAVESQWLRPEDALERLAAGDLEMISPTTRNLEAIAGYASTESLLEAKRAVDPSTIPTIRPRIPEPGEAVPEGEIFEIIGYGGEGED